MYFFLFFFPTVLGAAPRALRPHAREEFCNIPSLYEVIYLVRCHCDIIFVRSLLSLERVKANGIIFTPEWRPTEMKQLGTAYGPTALQQGRAVSKGPEARLDTEKSIQSDIVYIFYAVYTDLAFRFEIGVQIGPHLLCLRGYSWYCSQEWTLGGAWGTKWSIRDQTNISHTQGNLFNTWILFFSSPWSYIGFCFFLLVFFSLGGGGWRGWRIEPQPSFTQIKYKVQRKNRVLALYVAKLSLIILHHN